MEGHDILRRSMPNFFMREISVVRLIPMRAAAPSGPPTRRLVTLKRRTISSRSAQWPRMKPVGPTSHATGGRLAHVPSRRTSDNPNTLRGPFEPYGRIDHTETEVIERQRAANQLLVIVTLQHDAGPLPFPECAPLQSTGSTGRPDQFKPP